MSIHSVTTTGKSRASLKANGVCSLHALDLLYRHCHGHPPTHQAENITQIALDPYDQSARSATPTDNGLKINSQPGDIISIDGHVATWTSGAGEHIARIDLTPMDNALLNFEFNELTSTIEAKVGGTSTPGMARPAACMPKWVQWAFKITWGTLVCVPASIGAGGIATPIAGITTGAACKAAGGIMVKAVAC